MNDRRYDSFLPQFEAGFVVGNASGAMCSYSSVNGVPSCANSLLLTDLVRNRWNRPSSLITSDCGAVSNQFGAPMNSPGPNEITARSLNSGLDLEAGSALFAYESGIVGAISEGLLDEKVVDAALTRNLLQLMRGKRRFLVLFFVVLVVLTMHSKLAASIHLHWCHGPTFPVQPLGALPI